MKLPEQIIESVQQDLPLYEEHLQKIAQAIVEQHISAFPVFIAHRAGNLLLGKRVIDAEQWQTQWHIHASLLEEIAQKKIIAPQKVNEFKTIYKDPHQYACLFIVYSETDAGFAFYPYRNLQNF